MSEKPLIDVRSVSKKFTKTLNTSMKYGIIDITRDLAGLKPKSGTLRKEEFWSIKDISFQLKRGECLGLIGPNGAGKSTLLKMVNGLIPPDRGALRVTGQVGALIEVGAGFHPQLTGRENIYVNASILGISKRDIEKKIDAIINFSELGDKIDTPVKFYSSGMYVRLGFAIAAQMEPDVMLIDEILAVGDAGFRSKCYSAIDRMISNAAVIFVSHNMEAITRICNRVMVLDGGECLFDGNSIDAVSRYTELFEQERKDHLQDGFRLESFTVNGNGLGPVNFEHGSNLKIDLNAYSPEARKDLLLKINITDSAGQLVAELNSRNLGRTVDLKEGMNNFKIDVSDLLLLPRRYYLSLSIIAGRAEHLLWCRNLIEIKVTGQIQGHQAYQLTGKISEGEAG